MKDSSDAEELLEILETTLEDAKEFASTTQEWGPRNCLSVAVIDLKRYIERENECHSTNTNVKNAATGSSA